MEKRTTLGQPNRNVTRRAVQEAIREVQRAVQPRKKALKKQKRESGSKILALAAGAAVLWRGYQVFLKDAQAVHDTDRVVGLTPRPLTGTDAAAQISAGDAANDAIAEAKPKETVTGFAALAKEFYARFNADECMTRSYALAFILVLSLVPLLLFALAITGFVIQSPEQAADYTRQLISGLLPGQQAGEAVNDFIAQAHIAESAKTLMNGKGWALAGGIVSLLWAAIGLFVSASDPMNRAWEVTETRSFVKLRLVALGVFAAAFAFFALSLVVTSGAHGALARLGIPDSLPMGGAFLLDLFFFALAALINGGMFTLIYKFLPNATLSWKSAAFGGLIVGVLMEVFKQGFALYLAHFANFNKLYGTFGGIFLLVTWISYSCVLLLAGAIVCKMHHEHRESGGVQRKAT